MRRPIALFAVTACLLQAGSAAAATWYGPNDLPASARALTPIASSAPAAKLAERLLQTERRAFGLERAELSLQRELALGGIRTVRFSQRHQGLPVFDSHVVVRTAGGRVDSVVVDVARSLHVAPNPALSPAEALRHAVEFARHNPRLSMNIAPAETELGVLRDDSVGGILVWRVDIPTVDGGWRTYVNAKSGVIHGQAPRAVHAHGRVYPRDPVTTPNLEDVELLELVASDPQRLTGWNGHLTVTNYSGGDINRGSITVVQEVGPNSGEDFLYDPPTNPRDTEDAFAQVNLYYHLTRMKEFYEANLAVDMSAASWKLTAVANVQDNGSLMDNAFFSPQGITGDFRAPNLIGIGQGSVVDFALDSDVFLHEFTHYVSHNAIGYNGGQVATSAYGLSPWGGSIDEGISDYFACSENGDPLLGETSLGALGAQRNLAAPTKTCPSDMVGEVHADGELIGNLGWHLREELGKEVADQLVWGAASLLTTTSTFGDFGRGLKQTAAAMEQAGTLTAADLTTVEAAVTARGLDQCDNVLPLEAGSPVATNMLGLDMVAQLLGGGCQSAKQFVTLTSLFHFVSQADTGAHGIRFDVNLLPQGSGDLDWGIYVRKGQHVGMSRQGFIPEVRDYDYSVAGLTGRAGEIVIDADSNPPFDPTAEYYVVLSHQNCPFSSPEISVTHLGEPSTGGAGGAGGAGGSAGTAGTGAGGSAGLEGTAGVAGSAGSSQLTDEGDVSGGGCGCRVADSKTQGRSSAPHLGGLLGLLLGLGLWVRRRR
ncbi:MAG: hypothetical protein KIT72_00170 [Polyangiaceae bacterium]|nr:hypothetical protein [Polyangiaceae bacterium]MCW5788810.1 hypothetical protein [Polyangiaceae bacterium]